MGKIVAADFDGTIVQHRFPNIGEELPYAVATLKKLRENGHRVFLYTMRGHPDLSKYGHLNYETGEFIEQDTLQEALDWCKERGLVFDGVNRSPEQFSTSTKQYASVYIDDAALGCPLDKNGVDWIRVMKLLVNQNLLSSEDVYEILGDYIWKN